MGVTPRVTLGVILLCSIISTVYRTEYQTCHCTAVTGDYHLYTISYNDLVGKTLILYVILHTVASIPVRGRWSIFEQSFESHEIGYGFVGIRYRYAVTCSCTCVTAAVTRRIQYPRTHAACTAAACTPVTRPCLSGGPRDAAIRPPAAIRYAAGPMPSLVYCMRVRSSGHHNRQTARARSPSLDHTSSNARHARKRFNAPHATRKDLPADLPAATPRIHAIH